MLREKLEKTIKQHSGKVLNDIPNDVNYFESISESLTASMQGHSGSLTNRGDYLFSPDDKKSELIVLLCQAKDFRKPKYISALITGESLTLHPLPVL
jgi:hypothetical protein